MLGIHLKGSSYLEFQINISELNESNRFLRALWAELRETFGICAWHYRPFKNGPKQIIHIGSMCVGVTTCEVYLSYEKKGSIKNLYFDLEKKILDAQVLDTLNKCVKKARETFYTTKQFMYSIVLQSCTYSPAIYSSSRFSISPFKNGLFSLKALVDGYDTTDAKTVFRQRVNEIMDVLSVFTNTAFRYPNKEVRKSASRYKSKVPSEIYQKDHDWIDNIPVKNRKLILSREALIFINTLLENTDPVKEILILLKACNLYHTARKLEEQFNPQHIDTQLLLLGASQVEMCNVLYVSALEAVSMLSAEDEKTCQSCGQVIYGISKRVITMVEQIEPKSGLKSIVREHYQNRSKYLHVGQTLAVHNYTGTSIPQLDPTTSSGCMLQTVRVDKVLREATSYIIRKKIFEAFKTNEDPIPFGL